MGQDVYVRPQGNRWLVRKELAERATAITETRAQALRVARETAKKEGSKIFITEMPDDGMAALRKKPPPEVRVADFLKKLPNVVRRKEAQELTKLMEAAAGIAARMWGPTIVGFGRKATSRRDTDWFITGFTPRDAGITIYFSPDLELVPSALLKRLGPHTAALTCVTIKHLADIDQRVLSAITAHVLAGSKE